MWYWCWLLCRKTVRVNQLPEIPQTIEQVDTVIDVQDSKEGWARALRKLIGHLYMGEAPQLGHIKD